MASREDALDAKIEALQDHRAGRPLSVSESTGQAADQWASYDTARRRAHIGELHEIARLRSENARIREYLDAAYEYAWSEVLMNVGPKTSAETRDDFLDAMTNWAVDTGRQAPEQDDTLGSEL